MLPRDGAVETGILVRMTATYRPCKFVCIKYIKNRGMNFGLIDVMLFHSGHRNVSVKSCSHVQRGD